MEKNVESKIKDDAWLQNRGVTQKHGMHTEVLNSTPCFKRVRTRDKAIRKIYYHVIYALATEITEGNLVCLFRI